MFGSTNTASTPFGSTTNTPFGGGASTPFGTPSPAPSTGFAFGSQAQNTNTGGFGAPSNNTQSVFGNNNNTNTAGNTGGFGGFGQPNNNAVGGAFGSTSQIGSSSPFGAPAPAAPAAGGLFGGGAPAAATGGGLFGSSTANAPSTGGLFGGNTNNNNTNSAFGAPSTPSAFGGFGSTNNTNSVTNNAGGGLFGSGSTTGGMGTNTGGMFGQSPGANTQPGTTAVQYQPTSHSENNGSITFEAITAMPQYQQKSFEELRFEDYSAGNKGSQGMNTGAVGGGNTGFGGFGATPAPAPGGFGFGAAPAPATGGLFGGNAAAPKPAFGGFGAASPAPAPGAFSFGATPTPAAPAAGGFGFGAKPAAAPTGGLFGAPAPAPAAGGLFGGGAPAAAPTTGLFGAPAPAPSTGLFGAPAPAPSTGGLFGAPAPAPAAGGLFGGGAAAPKPAFGGFGATTPAPAAPGAFSFGATPAPAAPAAGGFSFGAPAATAPAPAGGLFGAPAPAPATGGLFGAPAPAPATGLFGAPAPAPATGGLFGTPAPAPATGGLFGAPATAPARTTSLFGAPAPAPAVGGGLFGAPAAPGVGLAQQQAPTMGVQMAPPAPPSSEMLLAQKMAAVEQQKKELELMEAWRGSTAESSILPSSESEKESSFLSKAGMKKSGVSSYAISSAALQSFHSEPSSATKIRPRGFGSTSKKLPQLESGRLGSSKSGSSILSPDVYISSSAKRLVIQPGALSKTRKLLLPGGGESDSKSNGSSPPKKNKQDDTPNRNTGAKVSFDETPNTRAEFISPSGSVKTPEAMNTPHLNGKGSSVHTNSTPKSSVSPKNGFSYQYYREVTQRDDSSITSPIGRMNGGNNNCVPKLTKPGYIVSPSIEEMSRMSEADLAAVSNFKVECPEHGSILWVGAVDVRNINLDSVVEICNKEVIVYEAEEASGKKPPVGSKLNRPAVITLYNLYPKKAKDADEPTLEAVQKYAAKIEKNTHKMGAKYISYDPAKGVWKFQTPHFSRWGFDDDESDDEEPQDNKQKNPPAAMGLALYPGQGFQSPEKGSASYENSMMVVSDEDSNGENETRALYAAENAYKALLLEDTANFQQAQAAVYNQYQEQNAMAIDDETNVASADDEIPSLYVLPKSVDIDVDSLLKKRSSISSKIAKKCGYISSTSIKNDFSLRMRRSFRVGWKPDGSFVMPSSFVPSKSQQEKKKEEDESTSGVNKLLIQKRPKYQNDELSTQIGSEDSCHIPLLENHLKHSTKAMRNSEQCPMFKLPKGLGAEGGSVESYKALCSALDDFIDSSEFSSNRLVEEEEMKDEELKLIPNRSFKLLSTLYGQEKDAFNSSSPASNLLVVDENVKINSSSSALVPNMENEKQLSTASERRFMGVVQWLEDAVANDIDDLILGSIQAGQPLAAVFIALTGGDVSKACEIATDHGYFRLSLLISNGFTAESDIGLQRKFWYENGALSSDCNISPMLVRIYALLSGDLEMEENLFRGGGQESFDWRRRLGMKFWCRETPSFWGFSSVINEYDDEYLSGTAPPPFPRYVNKNYDHEGAVSKKKTSGHEWCILYRLLKLRASGGGKDGYRGSALSHVVSPLGYTSSVHDYSLSFHVATMLQALGCCPDLSVEEEGRLLESYAVMLVDAGLWEWALYILLNSTKNGDLAIKKAKELVLRFYLQDTNNDKSSAAKVRSFLEENVGVPSYWFEEALATQCSYNGDIKGYVSHLLSSGQTEQALMAAERLILPGILGNSSQKQKLKQFLEALKREGGDTNVRWTAENGCGAILDLLETSEEAAKLSKLSDAELKNQTDRINTLLGNLMRLKQKILDPSMISDLQKKITRKDIYIDLCKFPAPSEEEYNIAFAEAFTNLDLLQMQVKLLQTKVSSNVDSNTTKNSIEDPLMGSQLAFLTYSGQDGAVSATISSEGLRLNSLLRGISGCYAERM